MWKYLNPYHAVNAYISSHPLNKTAAGMYTLYALGMAQLIDLDNKRVLSSILTVMGVILQIAGVITANYGGKWAPLGYVMIAVGVLMCAYASWLDPTFGREALAAVGNTLVQIGNIVGRVVGSIVGGLATGLGISWPLVVAVAGGVLFWRSTRKKDEAKQPSASTPSSTLNDRKGAVT